MMLLKSVSIFSLLVGLIVAQTLGVSTLVGQVPDTMKVYFQKEDYGTPVEIVSNDGEDTLIFDDGIFVRMTHDTIHKHYIHVAKDDTIILNYMLPDKKDTAVMIIYPGKIRELK